jgi:hypothetical protein
MMQPERNPSGLEREFLGYALAQAHPLVREWRGNGLEADLREDVAASVRTLGDDAEAQRVAGVMHRVGLPAAGYKGRLLTIADLRCIAHIDFPDPSGDFPFVKIRAASVPPGSIGDCGPISEGMARAFAEFRPRAVRFFHPSHVPLKAPTARGDTHLLAARALTMAERPEAAALDRVELRRAASLDFYPRYAAAYEQVLDERPYLQGEVSSESRASLAGCLEEGLLFEVLVDGAWSGIIAARGDMIAGMRGVHVVEIVLIKAARGQKLGPAVHQRFARSVAANDPAAIIMGTIAAENAPSLRTALRAGRLEIGAWHWVDLQLALAAT